MASEARGEVSRTLERAESDLEDTKEHMEIQLDDARNKVNRLEWKFELAEREAELLVTLAKERAQADHKKELVARNELLAFLKEKLSRQGDQKATETEVPPPHKPQAQGGGVPPILHLRGLQILVGK